jgi:xanthine dehydrogenase YagT iron-sulfur-binding subunit
MANRISRRDFLKETGAVLTGTALPDARLAVAESTRGMLIGAQSTDAGPREIVLDVNRVQRTVTVEPNMTLAEVLRGPLNLTGTKIGCDRGACSACTVWIDRVSVLSCMTLAVDVGERKLTTIEGLARGNQLHPVQSAFIAHDAIQCGFCTPGLAMSGAALLESNQAPSLDDAKTAISGHLCRCGTMPHVLDALLDAAKAMKS